MEQPDAKDGHSCWLEPLIHALIILSDERLCGTIGKACQLSATASEICRGKDALVVADKCRRFRAWAKGFLPNLSRWVGVLSCSCERDEHRDLELGFYAHERMVFSEAEAAEEAPASAAGAPLPPRRCAASAPGALCLHRRCASRAALERRMAVVLRISADTARQMRAGTFNVDAARGDAAFWSSLTQISTRACPLMTHLPRGEESRAMYQRTASSIGWDLPWTIQGERQATPTRQAQEPGRG